MIILRFLQLACLILFSVYLTACVDLTPVKGHALSSVEAQRFSDDIIARDWTEIDNLRQRLAKVRDNAPLLYAIIRVEGLIEFGAIEYAENDKTGVLEPVLDDALRLLISQENKQTQVNLDFPQIAGIHHVRADLWQKTKLLKQDAKKLNCAGDAIARLEIGLLELAHEQYEVDVKLNTPEHTVPFIGFIDGLNKALDEQLLHCHDKTPTKKWVLSADALFYFDEYSESNMLPEGKTKLNNFANELKSLIQQGEIKSSYHLVITGHTDRLGGHGYNIILGQNRANTIANILNKSYQLPMNQLETRSMGYASPVKYCSGVKITDELKACLQPNRRVEIELMNESFNH